MVCTCCVLPGSLLAFFSRLSSLGPHVFFLPQFTHVLPIRTWHRQQAHSTAQHRAINSAQAARGIVNSIFAPNHGTLLSAPLTCFSCILPCASVAGGVSRPRSGTPVLILLLLLYVAGQLQKLATAVVAAEAEKHRRT